MASDTSSASVITVSSPSRAATSAPRMSSVGCTRRLAIKPARYPVSCPWASSNSSTVKPLDVMNTSAQPLNCFAVLERNSEQLADHGDGEGQRHRRDEVDRLRHRRHRIQQVVDDLLGAAAERLHPPRRERRAHQPPDASVRGRVHTEDRVLDREELRHATHVGPDGGGAAEARIAEHGAHVLVAGQHPARFAEGQLHACDRLGRTQHVEQRVRVEPLLRDRGEVRATGHGVSRRARRARRRASSRACRHPSRSGCCWPSPGGGARRPR